MLVVFLYYIDELYVFTLHIEHILHLFFVECQFSGTPTVEGREGQVVSVIGAVVDVSSMKASQRSSMPSPSSVGSPSSSLRWPSTLGENTVRTIAMDATEGHFR